MYIEFREPEPSGNRGVCLSRETRFHDCGFQRIGDLRKKIDSEQDFNQWECCTDNFLKFLFQN